MAVQKPPPMVGFIDADVRVIGHQKDTRSGLHVAVIGDVVIYAVGGLDPVVKDVDEIGQRNVIRRRGKHFHTDPLKLHLFQNQASG
jgi:hypothetical protein